MSKHTDRLDQVSRETCPLHWNPTPLSVAFQMEIDGAQNSVAALIVECSMITVGIPNAEPDVIAKHLDDDALATLANRIADAVDQVGASAATAEWVRRGMASRVQRALNRFGADVKTEIIYRLPGSTGTKPAAFIPQVKRSLHDGDFMLGIRITRKAKAERESLIDERDTRREADDAAFEARQARQAEKDAQAAQAERDAAVTESLVSQARVSGYDEGYAAALLDAMSAVQAMLESGELVVAGQTRKRSPRQSSKVA